MNEKVLVLVRATPEKTKNRGYLVCVAGINDENEFRRLYPFEFQYASKFLPFKKKDVLEVKTADPDHDKRRESRKAIEYKNLNSPLEDEEVRERILPLISSIEKLKEDDASLGIIQPELTGIEIEINDTNIYDNQKCFDLTGDFLEKVEKVKMPIEVRYLFKCKNEPNCNGHKIILIDWEINELARNVMKKDKNIEVIKEKVKKRLYDFMLERDLYFIMGTHFRFKTWLIIGLFYPKPKVDSPQKSLFDF